MATAARDWKRVMDKYPSSLALWVGPLRRQLSSLPESLAEPSPRCLHASSNSLLTNSAHCWRALLPLSIPTPLTVSPELHSHWDLPSPLPVCSELPAPSFPRESHHDLVTLEGIQPEPVIYPVASRGPGIDHEIHCSDHPHPPPAPSTRTPAPNPIAPTSSMHILCSSCHGLASGHGSHGCAESCSFGALVLQFPLPVTPHQQP